MRKVAMVAVGRSIMFAEYSDQGGEEARRREFIGSL